MAYQTTITAEELREDFKVLTSSEVQKGFDSLQTQALIDNFIDVVKNHYFCFDGTTGRRVFWQYFLMLFPVWIVAIVVGIVLSIIISPVFSGISGIVILALICPTLGIGARRLHDTGKSGWLQLIPVVGLILCLPKGKGGCSCGCGCGCEQK